MSPSLYKNIIFFNSFECLLNIYGVYSPTINFLTVGVPLWFLCPNLYLIIPIPVGKHLRYLQIQTSGSSKSSVSESS